MYGILKPGKAARITGAAPPPHLAALIDAKRRNEPLEPVMRRIIFLRPPALAHRFAFNSTISPVGRRTGRRIA